MCYKEARVCIIRPTCALHLVRAWAANCGKLPRKSGNRAAGCKAQAACRDGTTQLPHIWEAILQVIIQTDATGGFPVERKHFHVTLQFSRFDDAQVYLMVNNGWRGKGNATSAFYKSLPSEQGYRTAYANKYDRTTLFYAKRVTAVTSSGGTMDFERKKNTKSGKHFPSSKHSTALRQLSLARTNVLSRGTSSAELMAQDPWFQGRAHSHWTHA
ncbi:hypothetical protein ALC62_12209 [Cyphomyrmex costatus]|uniref:Uncharacterized protein n=1 Tax=Cyphomyrmex costatus TaxID=456900 RepID=A0A195CA82_9HYME|nr:hypothetical protein ALC62_12209 [Cyphomyrmex costatus]